jgi:integrase
VTGIKSARIERSRDRVLSLPELWAVLQAAAAIGYPFGPIITMLALTGQRREEVAGAAWGEFDLDRAVWNIPGERTKNGRAHLVHLAPPVLALLQGLPHIEHSPYVFSTNGQHPCQPLLKSKKARFDFASQVTDWTIHGLRRTFATLATEHLEIEPVVVDRILNHVSGAVKGIAAVYQRGEYLSARRESMTRFASFFLNNPDKNRQLIRVTQT